MMTTEDMIVPKIMIDYTRHSSHLCLSLMMIRNTSFYLITLIACVIRTMNSSILDIWNFSFVYSNPSIKIPLEIT
jgi:hypothetical protein